MMAKDTSIPLLSEEARGVIWRIFGAGVSPLNGRATNELIEPVIRKRVCHNEQARAIAEIHAWFEFVGNEWRLRPDMAVPVALMILDGIGPDRSETATFAVGSINGDLAASIIGSNWPKEEIDSLVEATLATLERLCRLDEVLDASRVPDFAAVDASNAKIPKESLEKRGKLETFWNLDTYSDRLVHSGLHPVVENLIRLVVRLRRELLKSMIERLDHPVIQARVADYMVGASDALDHRQLLQWITKDSCDAAVALAIVHTLNALEGFDADLRYASRLKTGRSAESTEHGTDLVGPDAEAADLLTGLVDRLADLPPLPCARWIGELLANAPHMLRQGDERETPHPLKQLENACTEVLALLVRESWSEALLAELRAGLSLTPRTTWPRHLAKVAWALREVARPRAAEIARATLDEDKRYVASELESNTLFVHWADWNTREWISGLGEALALSVDKLDLPTWVSAQCRALPLSVWDAEENVQAFGTADRAVQHWFLVAFHAVESMEELGRKIDPGVVRTLAETFWGHCHFAGQFGVSEAEASVVSEHAARFAIEYGDASDTWVLDQVRNPAADPCALWALIHQRMKRGALEARVDPLYDEMINTGIIRGASDRFGDGTQLGLEALQYWGQLWLLLEAVDEAEQTAMAMLTFPSRLRERGCEILVLKLLALAASKRKLAVARESILVSTYHHLWSSYTPSEERDERCRIDEKLERSGVRT